MSQHFASLRSFLTARLVFVGLLASIATFSQGYDNGWWGFILAVPGFNAMFESSPNAGLSIVQLGVGTAMTNLGVIISSPFVAWTVNRYGRVRGFYCYSLLTIIATVIQITCGVGGIRYWQLVGGKFVIGFAIGFGSLVVPLYLSEVAPAQVRGALINFYSFNTWLGTFLATAMAYAVKNRLSSIVYILPIAIQFVPAIINLVCAPLMPESPRWLCSQGRHEEAKKSLVYLYGQRSGGFDIDAEYQQLRSDVERVSSSPSRSWKDCFKGIDRLRTATSVGALCLLQGQGLGFVASYSNILLAELTSAYAEIFIAILAALVILSSISFVTLDRIGRRTLLLYGSAISAVCMIAYGIIYSITPHPEGHLASLAVAFLTIWLVVYTQSWSTAPFAIYSEIPSAELRAKTLALGSIASQLVNVIVTLTSPFIESSNGGTFGGQIGYIFGSVSIFAFVFTFFMIPELKGRSLEEVDMMYKSGVAVRQMGRQTVDVNLTLLGDSGMRSADDMKGQDMVDEHNDMPGPGLV